VAADVSPVEALSAAGAGVLVTAAVSADAVVLSAPAPRCVQAAKPSTLPTSRTRASNAPAEETAEAAESSKERFIDMLFRSCTVPRGGRFSVRGA
jgi:hypothetical protein